MVAKYKNGEVIVVGGKEWVVSSAEDGTTVLLPKEEAPKPTAFTITTRDVVKSMVAQAKPATTPLTETIYGVFSRKQAEENGSNIWAWDGKEQPPITDLLYLSDKKVKQYPDMMIVRGIEDITSLKYIRKHQPATWWKDRSDDA